MGKVIKQSKEQQYTCITKFSILVVHAHYCRVTILKNQHLLNYVLITVICWATSHLNAVVVAVNFVPSFMQIPIEISSKSELYLWVAFSLCLKKRAQPLYIWESSPKSKGSSIGEVCFLFYKLTSNHKCQRNYSQSFLTCWILQISQSIFTQRSE